MHIRLLRAQLRFKKFRYNVRHWLAVRLRRIATWLDSESEQVGGLDRSRYRLRGERFTWR